MESLTIGITREGKIPVDYRTPLTPSQARKIMDTYPWLKVVCQSSELRCYSDNEYSKLGVQIVERLDQCDVIFGVKEVPIGDLIPDKTYFFFSHTIKKQSYNRALLQSILKNNIRLIDYECLTNPDGKRIIAFGRYAGIVGAYNTIWTFGKRYNLFDVRRARDCFDLEDLKKEYDKIKLPTTKIVITGGGRVAKGAMEVLLGLNIRKVSPANFLIERYDGPVFTQLNSRDYHKRRDGGTFNRFEFFNEPQKYEGDFLKYTRVSDILIACAYWDPKSPVLFRRQDILQPSFEITVIGDVTCDIEGSIPSTKKPATIEDPIYDYNPSQDSVEPALSDEANLTVMAVDNLPCELPRDASNDFGSDLINKIFPHLMGNDSEKIIERATIAKDGSLTDEFKYLQAYVDGK